MAVVEKVLDNNEHLVGYLMRSPATNELVCFYKNGWSFNGDFEKPTFRPSMLVHPDGLHQRDHFFVTDGKIEYLSDSEHDFAGKTVDAVEVDADA